MKQYKVDSDKVTMLGLAICNNHNHLLKSEELQQA